MPNSAKESIVNILVNNPFTPKYSALKFFMNIVLTINDKTIFSICVKAPDPKFIIVFFVLELLITIPLII